MKRLEGSNIKGKPAFWKNRLTTVPGSIQLVSNATPKSTSNSVAVATLEEKVSCEDDNRNVVSKLDGENLDSTPVNQNSNTDELCFVADVKILNNVAKSTAEFVITNHKDQAGKRESVKVHSSFRRNKRSLAAKQFSDDEGTKPGLGIYSDCNGTRNQNKNKFIPGIAVRQTACKGKGALHNCLNVLQKPSITLITTKFESLLNEETTDLGSLRTLSWKGVPEKLRFMVWKLLAGYLPVNRERRAAVLKRKREEYFSFVKQYYDTRHTDIFQETYRQIHKDVPRMTPAIPIIQQLPIQQIFERILYIWALRHPASGYVQGMNDLVTPFFVVFLHEYIPENETLETVDTTHFSQECLQFIEADCFWCLNKLLDGIQDNYTFAQPGIQTKITKLREIIQRIDSPLYEHLQNNCIEFLQFAFRWVNNILVRELPLRCTLRLWDTCLSEPEGFSTFHLYVCVAFLKYWSQAIIKEDDFQGVMMLLQNLPTNNWSDEEVNLLVADAYRLKFTFEDAPNHLHLYKDM